MKKIKCLFIILMMLLICSCGKTEEKNIEEYDGVTYYETSKKSDNVLILLEDERKIIVELYPDIAPITVSNFKKLVAENFYDDVIFHRVVKDFVIQAGDASNLGRSAKTIKGEFSANGVENNLHHTKGVISMARNSISMDSASSQFFIMLEDNENLDGQYAAFGSVIAGMSVVESIGNVMVDNNDKPLKDIKIKTMKFVEIEENK